MRWLALAGTNSPELAVLILEIGTGRSRGGRLVVRLGVRVVALLTGTPFSVVLVPVLSGGSIIALLPLLNHRNRVQGHVYLLMYSYIYKECCISLTTHNAYDRSAGSVKEPMYACRRLSPNRQLIT